ncbi:MAG: hypothetical protein AAFU78_01500 [Cyanobacteria bacterium J06633_2]
MILAEKKLPVPTNSDISSLRFQDLSLFKLVCGVAIFDTKGLLRKYFTADNNSNVTWLQTGFNVLSLKSLLETAFQFDGFGHATVHASSYRIIVIQQHGRYVAFLFRSVEHCDITWLTLRQMKEFEPSFLHEDPRFSSVFLG